MTIGTQGDGRTERAERQRENRRARILETALRVFAERGYHNTHVAEIIEAAGIARGTFYLYFEGKGAIFIELLDELLLRFRAEVVGIDTVPKDPSFAPKLRGALMRLFRVAEKNRPLLTIIMREAVGLDREVEARLRSFYDELHQFLVESLEEGIDKDLVRPVDREMAAMCIAGSIKYVMERMVAADPADDADIEPLVDAFLDYHLWGLRGIDRDLG